MQYKIYIFLFQFITLGFTNVKALLGSNVRPVQEYEFLGVVCILLYNPDVDYQQKLLCSGTLISHNYVLTAEHCFTNTQNIPIEIVMTSHIIDNGERYYPIWWITFNQWSVLQGQLITSPANDIMIIKIFGVYRDNPTVTIGAFTPHTLLYGLHVDAVGCGKIDSGIYPPVLHTVKLKVVDINICSEIISDLQGTPIIFEPNFICTISTPYAQISKGDSGGPLLYFGILVGINIGVCPIMDGQFNPNKVNMHINLYDYRHFVSYFALPDNI